MLTQTTIRTAARVTDAIRELFLDGRETMGRAPVLTIFSVEESNEPLYVFRVTDEKGTCGIEIFRGDGAASAATERYLNIIGVGSTEEDMSRFDAELITAVWTRLENIPESLRELPYALGYRGRRDTFAPDLAVKPLDRNERSLRPPELRLVERVLRGMLQARAEGLLDESNITDLRVIMHFTVEGEGSTWRVNRELEHLTFPDEALRFLNSAANPNEECPDGDPETADHGAWRDVGRLCHARMFRRAQEIVDESPGLADKFFGRRGEGLELMEDWSKYGADAACLSWIAMYKKSGADKTTVLERMLVESTSRLEREFISAWMHAKLSAFRITSVQRGESLALIDLIDGREYVAHDRGAAEQDLTNVYVFGWGFSVHGHGYILSLGPYLQTVHYGPAVALLAKHGVKLTHASFAKKPEVFGRLFEIVAEFRTRNAMPKMTNTDGEEIENVCGMFSVADVSTLRRELSARPDVKEIEDDFYHWFRTQEDGPGLLAGNTHLARLELIDDELIVNVNSAGRLQRITEWLTRIPGVRFVRSHAEAVDFDRAPATDADTALPDVPAEMMDKVRDVIRQQMMMWLDIPIPALDGKTPRNYAVTPAGRAKVKSMILAMPSVEVARGQSVEPPRAELFRELGLE